MIAKTVQGLYYSKEALLVKYDNKIGRPLIELQSQSYNKRRG